MRIHKIATDAVAAIQSSTRVFVHGGAATPNRLLQAVVDRADSLRSVEFTHLHLTGKVPFFDQKLRASFRNSAFFLGANMRPFFEPGQFDYIPCFLSEIPALFRSGHLSLDAALIHVSPPDVHGFCTLGTSVDVARAAVDTAKVIIAQVNKKMPRTMGDGVIHISKIHHAIECEDDVHEDGRHTHTPEETAIGK
jgi:4-hydroxybutyrate CoA-transferase